MIPWRAANAVLAATCILLAGVLHWRQGTQQTAAGVPLTDIDPQTVNSIRVMHGTRLHLELLRDDAGWMQTHPDIARAAPRRVQALLGLTRAPVRRRLDAGDDLAAFGLAPTPRARILFDDRPVAFGAQAATADQVYAGYADGLYLVDSVHRRLLDLPPQHFLERR